MRYPFPEVCPVVVPTSGPHRVRLAELVELVRSPLLVDRESFTPTADALGKIAGEAWKRAWADEDPGDECDRKGCECS